MFCKFCGQTLNASAAKCGRCGREVPAKSDCGGFFGILPGEVPAQALQPAVDLPAEKPAKKQIPVFSVILVLLLAAALVLIALQGGRLGELEKQLTELHEEISELKDELEDHMKAASQQQDDPTATVPDETLPLGAEPEAAGEDEAVEPAPAATDTIPG